MLRFTQIFRSNAAGLYGWSDTTIVIESEDEGRKLVAAPMPRGCFKQQADKLVGNRWECFAKRERSKHGKPTAPGVG